MHFDQAVKSNVGNKIYQKIIDQKTKLSKKYPNQPS